MSTATLPPIFSAGHELDTEPSCFGFLHDSSDAEGDFEELRTRLVNDGYLYLPGYLDREEVMGVRKTFTDRLAEQGLLDPNRPSFDGVADLENRTWFKPDLARKNPTVERLLYSGRLISFYANLFGEPIRHYDFTWLRAIGPGKGTNPHCDIVYMGRGTKQHLTCWVPYGDISLEMGGLMILEDSHRKSDRLRNYLNRDVDEYCENKPSQVEKAKNKGVAFSGDLSHNPAVLRKSLGGRWLTAEFRAGDFVTFRMNVIHGGLDNQTDRIRLSTDSRYQRVSEPIDERWIGVNPMGHGPRAKRGLIC
jgi:hypothetical protein